MPAKAKELVRPSAMMSRAAKDSRLGKRTLTNLYNGRPEWLKNVHEKLDRAVIAAYANVDPEGKWEEDWAAVWREGINANIEHSTSNIEHRKKREEVEGKVLGNLLRMNGERAG